MAQTGTSTGDTHSDPPGSPRRRRTRPTHTPGTSGTRRRRSRAHSSHTFALLTACSSMISRTSAAVCSARRSLVLSSGIISAFESARTASLLTALTGTYSVIAPALVVCPRGHRLGILPLDRRVCLAQTPSDHDRMLGIRMARQSHSSRPPRAQNTQRGSASDGTVRMSWPHSAQVVSLSIRRSLIGPTSERRQWLCQLAGALPLVAHVVETLGTELPIRDPQTLALRRRGNELIKFQPLVAVGFELTIAVAPQTLTHRAPPRRRRPHPHATRRRSSRCARPRASWRPGATVRPRRPGPHSRTRASRRTRPAAASASLGSLLALHGLGVDRVTTVVADVISHGRAGDTVLVADGRQRRAVAHPLAHVGTHGGAHFAAFTRVERPQVDRALLVDELGGVHARTSRRASSSCMTSRHSARPSASQMPISRARSRRSASGVASVRRSVNSAPRSSVSAARASSESARACVAAATADASDWRATMRRRRLMATPPRPHTASAPGHTVATASSHHLPERRLRVVQLSLAARQRLIEVRATRGTLVAARLLVFAFDDRGFARDGHRLTRRAAPQLAVGRRRRRAFGDGECFGDRRHRLARLRVPRVHKPRRHEVVRVVVGRAVVGPIGPISWRVAHAHGSLHEVMSWGSSGRSSGRSSSLSFSSATLSYSSLARCARSHG